MKALLPFASFLFASDEWLLICISLSFPEIWLNLALIFNNLHQILLRATGFDSEVVMLSRMMLLTDLSLNILFILSRRYGLNDGSAMIWGLGLLSILCGSSLLIFIVALLDYHHLNALIVEATENLTVSILNRLICDDAIWRLACSSTLRWCRWHI